MTAQVLGHKMERKSARRRSAHAGRFIRRMVASILSFIRNSVFADEMAGRRGLLQRLDPRAKLVVFSLLLVGALLTRRLDVLFALYVGTLWLALLSFIPLRFFLIRVWFFIPLFAGIIAIPVLFSPVSPGGSVVTLWKWADGTVFSITDRGLWMASVLVLRVATCVSLAVLLVLTTRWAHLLKALRIFGLPRIFVLTLEMTYRYIFLLIGVIQAEHLAKESRTIRPASLGAERRWAASRIGHLFLRSRQMGEEIYLAMVSRGYNGEAKVLQPFQFAGRDALALVGAGLLLATILLLNKGT